MRLSIRFIFVSLTFFLHCLYVNIFEKKEEKDKCCLQIKITINFFFFSFVFGPGKKNLLLDSCIIMSFVFNLQIFSVTVTLYNFYRYLLRISWDCFRGQTEGGVREGLSHDGEDEDEEEEEEGSQCLSATTALFGATVSFCCQSLIAKEHMNFSSRTGEDFIFLFLCSQDFSLFF